MRNANREYILKIYWESKMKEYMIIIGKNTVLGIMSIIECISMFSLFAIALSGIQTLNILAYLLVYFLFVVVLISRWQTMFNRILKMFKGGKG